MISTQANERNKDGWILKNKWKQTATTKEPDADRERGRVRNVSGSRHTGMAGWSDSSRFHAQFSQIASNLFQLVLASTGVTSTT
jgi:hypothetical protein